jgi:hypothetical protein
MKFIKRLAVKALIPMAIVSGYETDTTNQITLPIYDSTITATSNYEARLKEAERKVAATEALAVKKENEEKILAAYSQVNRYYLDYTNTLQQARNLFNSGLGDLTLSVTEQRSILSKYDDAEKIARDAEKIKRETPNQNYPVFGLENYDKNLKLNLTENIRSHNTNAVTIIEKALQEKGVNAKVEYSKRHHSGSIIPLMMIWWFMLRKKR